ncbi:thyroid transcription factor 1-associated protein 26 isoform X1 [Hyla sarda]|uniref:thyroid transcription factor 1-associated protein 26 isoform X1 n=1 Tax=Hyla sarda TaxID=327740 RepID=UPI0024C42E90|nr:thyroid transcription factor 1-associated protein 26 isoform X1 [Hyla sarda]
MGPTSASSVSVQYRKRDRNFGRRGRAALGNDGQLKVKGKREAPGGKRQDVQGTKGDRVPGKRPSFDGKVKRRWRPNPEQKLFKGSAKEGQGFALWRKEKIQFQYKKLLRKQKKANTKEVSYSDNYPEHLKHLYLAEEERLKSQEKQRKPKNETSETADKEKEVIPKKTFRKKTSNQKAKEEYERVQQERAKKREEAENNRRKREEAIKLYKERRTEAYKALSAKTKKGQPDFNVQMEYLLKKIQSKS